MAYRTVPPLMTFGASVYPGVVGTIEMPAAELPGGPFYQSGGPKRDLTGIFGMHAPAPRPPKPLLARYGVGDAEGAYASLKASPSAPSALDSVYRNLYGDSESASFKAMISEYETYAPSGAPAPITGSGVVAPAPQPPLARLLKSLGLGATATPCAEMERRAAVYEQNAREYPQYAGAWLKLAGLLREQCGQRGTVPPELRWKDDPVSGLPVAAHPELLTSDPPVQIASQQPKDPSAQVVFAPALLPATAVLASSPGASDSLKAMVQEAKTGASSAAVSQPIEQAPALRFFDVSSPAMKAMLREARASGLRGMGAADPAAAYVQCVQDRAYDLRMADGAMAAANSLTAAAGTLPSASDARPGPGNPTGNKVKDALLARADALRKESINWWNKGQAKSDECQALAKALMHAQPQARSGVRGLGATAEADDATKLRLSAQARVLHDAAKASDGSDADSIRNSVVQASGEVASYLPWDAPSLLGSLTTDAYDSSQVVKGNLTDAVMLLEGKHPPQAQDVNLTLETIGNLPASLGLPTLAPSEQLQGSASAELGAGFQALHPTSDLLSWGIGGKYGPGAGAGGACSIEPIKSLCDLVSKLTTVAKVGLGLTAAGAGVYGAYRLERAMRSYSGRRRQARAYRGRK